MTSPDPDSIENALAEAHRLQSQGRHVDAEHVCRKVLTLHESAGIAALQSAHESLIHSLYAQRRFGEAYASFKQLLRSLPTSQDEEFDSIYLEALRLTASPPVPLRRRARYLELINILHRTLHLQGEVAECGCFMGLSSYLICRYLQLNDDGFSGLGFQVFDSFAGLSIPTTEDSSDEPEDESAALDVMRQPGAFQAPLEHVRRSLSRFPDIDFRPGWIPASLQGLPEARYRFVHVDVDLYEPTRGALEYFHRRLVPGGLIVSDDYGWPGARRALTEFTKSRGIALEVNEMGQAVIAA